jgi:acyl-CoA thioester hydrolase
VTHSYELRVYYQDTDAGGIVYHANYLAFAERARAEALRSLNIPHVQMVRQFSVMLVVQSLDLTYLRPARLDEVIRIDTAIIEASGARVTLRQDFWRDADSLAVLKIRLGCARLADGRAARLPELWRTTLRAVLNDDEKG